MREIGRFYYYVKGVTFNGVNEQEKENEYFWILSYLWETWEK